MASPQSPSSRSSMGAQSTSFSATERVNRVEEVDWESCDIDSISSFAGWKDQQCANMSQPVHAMGIWFYNRLSELKVQKLHYRIRQTYIHSNYRCGAQCGNCYKLPNTSTQSDTSPNCI
ncbi:Hypothetical_protein [Hexamita inflata]|uniref:Hypothetical_protein n=1 Tax=Hexamita inflata TaxID=28002 RepID=A0AA86UGL1_9EUKA|nr:Hypothetical protein HINF_LOCUS42674 [Hexamita inflata]